MPYGLGSCRSMNYVVVPRSCVPIRFPYHPWPTVGGLAWHVFGVGLVISLIARWAIVAPR